MGMLVLSDIFCTFSRNTKLPNFGNIFREKYSSYFYKQGVIWKVIQFRKFSRQLFHLSVSSLFRVSLYISPKKFPKKWIFSKNKHLIDKNWQENLDIWLNNNPQSIRPIAVSYLAKKIQTSKNLGNFQQIKKYIRNIPILFKAMEKVHQSLVFVVLAVKHSIATSFWCCCYFSERVKYPTELP